MDTRLDELNSLQGYEYQIWNYGLGHSILTLYGTTEQKGHHNVSLRFTAVQYFQFPFSWTGDPTLGERLDKEILQKMLKMAERLGWPVIKGP